MADVDVSALALTTETADKDLVVQPRDGSAPERLAVSEVLQEATGLETVATDATVNGDGRTSSPIRVAEPYSADERVKLDGIAAGAEVNVQSDWNQETPTNPAYIRNKPDLGGGGGSPDYAADTRGLFGNYDTDLPTPAQVTYSNVAGDPGGIWTEMTRRTIATLSAEQYASGGALRGITTLIPTSYSGGAVRKFRVRYLNGSATLHTEHYPTDGGMRDYLVDLAGTGDNLVYEAVLDAQGVGFYSGRLEFGAVQLHHGDGAASAAVRAEVARQLAAYTPPYQFRPVQIGSGNVNVLSDNLLADSGLTGWTGYDWIVLEFGRGESAASSVRIGDTKWIRTAQLLSLPAATVGQDIRNDTTPCKVLGIAASDSVLGNISGYVAAARTADNSLLIGTQRARTDVYPLEVWGV